MTFRAQLRRSASRLAILAAIVAMVTPALADDPITPKSLLAEMTDLKHLARFPSPSYTTRQFSSHDPKSVSPSNHDAWFANEDWDHWIRGEQNDGREERVMMEADGPGAVVRIWSANPAGTMRVYIDGDKTPAIEAKMEDLLAGKVAGFPVPIAGVYSRGYNLYLPIPYARSCKITTDAKGFYYLVDYRTYASDAKVTSFKADDIKSLAEDIRKQGEILAKPSAAVAASRDSQTFDFHIAPGETKTLWQFSGPHAIEQMRFRLGTSLSESALRAAVLRITFDGEQTVEVPLGDFFGTAPGINPYESLPLGMSKDGEAYSHWYMPFRESAKIEVSNLGEQMLPLSGSIGSVAHTWTDDSMHFNAGYRSEYDLKTRPMLDWNYLTAKGKGALVGTAFAIDNPTRDWWGEGDEKIYVDGEQKPGWFGTGTEDYYGYAWCWPGLFQHAYHNQPRCDGPANYGRTSVNRFLLMDRIPFQQSLKFDMEIWHWKDTKVNAAVTTYWYATPGGSDEYTPLKPADLVVRPMEAYKKFQVAGAIEGEKMAVHAHTARVEPQDWADTSNEQHLWWHQGVKPGDKLELGFEVPQAGRYHVVARFLTAPDYGIARLAVNGSEVEKPIDLYAKEVKPSAERDLGTFDLKAGQNALTVTMQGANEKAKKEYLFGLDYLLLKPADAK